jgi:hypothetical protein
MKPLLRIPHPPGGREAPPQPAPLPEPMPTSAQAPAAPPQPAMQPPGRIARRGSGPTLEEISAPTASPRKGP